MALGRSAFRPPEPCKEGEQRRQTPVFLSFAEMEICFLLFPGLTSIASIWSRGPNDKSLENSAASVDRQHRFSSDFRASYLFGRLHRPSSNAAQSDDATRALMNDKRANQLGG